VKLAAFLKKKKQSRGSGEVELKGDKESRPKNWRKKKRRQKRLAKSTGVDVSSKKSRNRGEDQRIRCEGDYGCFRNSHHEAKLGVIEGIPKKK